MMPESLGRGIGIERRIHASREGGRAYTDTKSNYGGSVLNERRAEGMFYDAVIDVARVCVQAPPGTIKTRTVDGTLLLDAAGFLVGVDVEPAAPSRTLVMLGPHDVVAATVPARISVCTDASGGVFEVRIAGARAALRAHERNPYLG